MNDSVKTDDSVSAQAGTHAQKRQSLSDDKSMGYRLVEYLRAQAAGEGKKSAKQPKKNNKAVSINLRLNKNDLVVIDALAEHFKVSRSYILERMVSSDICTMFHHLHGRDQVTLADQVDKDIEESGFENEYRGRTWYWDTVEQDYNLSNPINTGNILEW